MASVVFDNRSYERKTVVTWAQIQLQINFRNLPLSIMEHKAGGWLVEQETGKVLARTPEEAIEIIHHGQ